MIIINEISQAEETVPLFPETQDQNNRWMHGGYSPEASNNKQLPV